MNKDFEVVYETPTVGYDFVVQCRYAPDRDWVDDARFRTQKEAEQYAYDHWVENDRIIDWRVIRLSNRGGN